MTREEYEKTYVRMMDSLRGEVFKGVKNCTGVDCGTCPLKSVCECKSLSFSVFPIIEVVEKWGKEHPAITNADKFEEVFGCKPQHKDGTYLCPPFGDGDCLANICAYCRRDYWESEYAAPKKDEEAE